MTFDIFMSVKSLQCHAFKRDVAAVVSVVEVGVIKPDGGPGNDDREQVLLVVDAHQDEDDAEDEN